MVSPHRAVRGGRPGDTEAAVRSTFTDLRRDSAAGLRINIDTDRSRPGPEFALLSGLATVTGWTSRG